MFSEVLKIIPRIDQKDANAMERTLNRRFAKVAKKFGGGLKNAILGGGLLGLATTLIDKVLNPIQAVQETLDAALSRADDLSTYAKQFGTTEGSLARLQAFGQATGLDPEGVRLLLGKFQAAVARAEVDPNAESAVAGYVGKKDTAEAFFNFVQSLQKIQKADPNAANLIQQQVFGEKQILKASEFLSADFKALENYFRMGGAPSAEQLTKRAAQTGQYADFRDIAAAVRGLKNIDQQGKAIGDSTITQLIRGEDVANAYDNARLGSYDELKKISMATDKLVKTLEQAYLKLAPYISQYLPELVDQLMMGKKALETSRTLRGLAPGNGKDR